jgi:hypothetical protein
VVSQVFSKKMKNFSLSTILGLTLGILLAGYAVFAFNPPTQAPPAGNVAAPINTGTSNQTKTGGTLNVFGLWVDQSLGVTGGASIGGALTVSGQPVCLGNGTNCPPSGVPAGFVGFFNLSSCPSGWSEVTGAQGRYVVGKPSGGTLGGTAGTALSNQENRAVGRHNHGVSDPGHGHTLTMRPHLRRPFDNNNQQTGSIGADSPSSVPTTLSVTGVTINVAGTTAGTNAPYIQFLVCQKN